MITKEQLKKWFEEWERNWRANKWSTDEQTYKMISETYKRVERLTEKEWVEWQNEAERNQREKMEDIEADWRAQEQIPESEKIRHAKEFYAFLQRMKNGELKKAKK